MRTPPFTHNEDRDNGCAAEIRNDSRAESYLPVSESGLDMTSVLEILTSESRHSGYPTMTCLLRTEADRGIKNQHHSSEKEQ
jgi:hypothetical protein